MYYLQSRYYDPFLGRFILSDDAIYGCITNGKISHNTFTYCRNNSINYVDETGYVAANVIGAVIGGVIGAVGGYFLTNWLADRMNLRGWKRNVFVWGLSALIGAAAAAIGYFVGPYVARAWSWLSAKLAGLLRGTYRSIAKISNFRMKTHINVPKHNWNKIMSRVTENNIKTVINNAIRKGTWSIDNKGVIRILWKYKGRVVEVRGKIINKIFNIADAFVQW